ncbi:ACT domain-containing protein [Erythrobacter crassostreae]|uniref:ACT domain-containing protein n=1 Tax=Erythrobacter crassostreae TaxID=2828328 RepID=A0A9X1F3L1_9SPHN|nr:ACT domain-containing protein [Erythrobacter crassostrea]MBV7259099.1 ACT domain-containing protein [Erythrobacter crassostrea]
MSTPVSDLQGMLAGMEPELRERPFRFVEHGPDNDFIDLLGTMFAFIREDEGASLVIHAKEDHPGPLFACITLRVHSDLEGVGLTAAVATALAEAGIACNVIAAFHHDHLFVPWGKRAAALAILTQLSQDARR